MKSKKARYLAICLTALGCSYATQSAFSQPPGELRVVLRPATVFVGEGEGAPKGFDVDLLEMFVGWHSRQTGRDVTYKAMNVTMVPELLDEVRAGNCDIAVGSITITEERDRTVDFSTPYLPLRTVVIARRGALPDGALETILDGRVVGAVVGTTHEALGKGLVEDVPNLALSVDFDTQAELFGALTNRNSGIDAAITDITHYWIMNQLQDVVVVSPIGPPQGLGFVLPEGSPLKPSVDAFLEEIRSTNTYFNLIERYFGQEAATMIRSSRGTDGP